MNEQTAALVDKLADKLGTTAEHLWGVLVTHAPISATVDLILCAALITGAAMLFTLVKRKSRDEPNDDYVPAWIGVAAVFGIVALLVISSMHGIVAGFLNPEYWALKQLLALKQ